MTDLIHLTTDLHISFNQSRYILWPISFKRMLNNKNQTTEYMKNFDLDINLFITPHLTSLTLFIQTYQDSRCF